MGVSPLSETDVLAERAAAKNLAKLALRKPRAKRPSQSKQKLQIGGPLRPRVEAGQLQFPEEIVVKFDSWSFQGQGQERRLIVWFHAHQMAQVTFHAPKSVAFQGLTRRSVRRAALP